VEAFAASDFYPFYSYLVLAVTALPHSLTKEEIMPTQPTKKSMENDKQNPTAKNWGSQPSQRDAQDENVTQRDSGKKQNNSNISR
jgi:hypothetical protein